MSYCTAVDVKSYNRDPDMDDLLLAILIPAVDAAIDKWCRRTFEVSANESRLYDAVDPYEILLRDDLVSIDSVVTNGGDSYVTADLVLWPKSGPPYRKITLADPSDTFSWTSTRVNANTVTGTWGYASTLPAMVKLAAIIWVSDLYATSDSRGISSISAGGIKTATKFLTDKPPDEVVALLPSPRVRIDALA